MLKVFAMLPRIASSGSQCGVSSTSKLDLSRGIVDGIPAMPGDVPGICAEPAVSSRVAPSQVLEDGKTFGPPRGTRLLKGEKEPPGGGKNERVENEEQAPAADGPRCLISPVGCPTPHEREVTRYALAMDSALAHVRLVVRAQARDGMVPAEAILLALSQPYRFPLPGDAEVLAAYRKVYGHGNGTILHVAECDGCEPAGRDGPDFCLGYYAAARADAADAIAEARAAMLAAEEEYTDALAGRMAEIAEQLSEVLPDGMRFEWTAGADEP